MLSHVNENLGKKLPECGVGGVTCNPSAVTLQFSCNLQPQVRQGLLWLPGGESPLVHSSPAPCCEAESGDVVGVGGRVMGVGVLGKKWMDAS